MKYDADHNYDADVPYDGEPPVVPTRKRSRNWLLPGLLVVIALAVWVVVRGP